MMETKNGIKVKVGDIWQVGMPNGDRFLVLTSEFRGCDCLNLRIGGRDIVFFDEEPESYKLICRVDEEPSAP